MSVQASERCISTVHTHNMDSKVYSSFVLPKSQSYRVELVNECAGGALSGRVIKRNVYLEEHPRRFTVQHRRRVDRNNL